MVNIAKYSRDGSNRHLPPLILMTDSHRLPDPMAVVAGLPRGSAVILRHYDHPERAKLARRLVALCRRRGLKLLIAGDPRLAAATHADGVHLPQFMARRGPGTWRLWRKPGWIVTAAAHSPMAISRAARAGADAVLLSPVLATASHPNARPIGILRAVVWRRTTTLAVYALGGMTLAGARRIRIAGFAGIAGVGFASTPND